MFEFLTAPATLPFAVALAIMAMLVVVELVGLMFGATASDLLDGLLPEFGDADGAELAGASLADRFMGWLHFGKVPALILLAVFLTGFGFLGLALQGALHTLTSAMLPGWLAAIAVFPLTLPWVRVVGSGIARAMPRDETQVVSRSALVGRVATIVIGTARRGSPAQAKVRDQHGQAHYVMVEPDQDEDSFSAGEAVLLVAEAGPNFRVIRNDNPALSV
jgi:hypothetical protein